MAYTSHRSPSLRKAGVGTQAGEEAEPMEEPYLLLAFPGFFSLRPKKRTHLCDLEDATLGAIWVRV